MLTPRQTLTLRLLTAGLPLREITRRTDLSPETVMAEVRTLLRTLLAAEGGAAAVNAAGAQAVRRDR